MKEEQLETKERQESDDIHARAERIARQILTAPPLRMAKSERKTKRKTSDPRDGK